MKPVLPSSPPAATRMATALKPATNQQVRTRFFNMIGINSQFKSGTLDKSCVGVGDSCAKTAVTALESAAAAGHQWVNPRSQRVACFTESLKYDATADKILSAKRRKTCDCHEKTSTERATGKRKKSLNFSETVKVVPIPMRTEYSNRVRSRLWSNAIEIHENATRNTIEFAAEGWDWRSVIEDEGMYVCVATGELIHPCHYEADFRADP